MISLDTVISLHQDLGPPKENEEEDMKSMRGNTFSVLKQLSTIGHDSADPISMQTVRQAREHDNGRIDPKEGASSLFYYLFDDWRAVYTTVSAFHDRLENLVSALQLVPNHSLLTSISAKCHHWRYCKPSSLPSPFFQT